MFNSKFSQRILLAFVVVGFGNSATLAELPTKLSPEIQTLVPGVRLTKVAEHPTLVTPTGIDVEQDGTLWVVSSHTHFRPEDYAGPEHDEVVRISPDGTRTVFYNATDATMDLELGSDGWVYLAERDRVLRVRDTDGDGLGDEEQNVAILETEADYPHNGLSGMAWHPSGDLVFALGENFWQEWTLTAPVDASAVTGSGEGGIFRCRADGSSLRRIARGFWNPFGICVREDGTMFAGENDPGARPPCRLLHIVEGGDYGYQRRYGNAPIHPFVCWNGELPGTLPMLHSVGEAPCGIAPLGNGLLVTSWTDHRVDFYPLVAAGASFRTACVNLIHGSDYFRPTCIAQHSATEFYLTDWVVGSYPIHGRGRVWKLEIDVENADWLGSMKLAPPNRLALQAEALRAGDPKFSDDQLFELAGSSDPFTSRAAIDGLATRVERLSVDKISDFSAPDRLTLLLAIRRAEPHAEDWAAAFLRDDSEQVVLESLRWIADEELSAFAPRVRAIVEGTNVTYPLFEAGLACWNALSGDPSKGIADQPMLLERIKDGKSAHATRAFALRLIDPDHKGFTPKSWRQLQTTGDPMIIRELTRTLAMTERAAAQSSLLLIAGNSELASVTRADAIAGVVANESSTDILLQFAESDNRLLREEALRSLRFARLGQANIDRVKKLAVLFPESADLIAAVIDAASVKQGRPQPSDIKAWRQRLIAVSQPIDREAGRRIFHHHSVGACAKCHRRDGRGRVVGPDLSAVSTVGDPDRLLVALLQPSKHVDPQYFARTLVTEDGDSFTGILLRDGGGGKEIYRDSDGRERAFKTQEIVARRELKTSVMPAGLIDLMTDREIRDLLAYLDSESPW